MNIRLHSNECETRPCRRCYIRTWDMQRNNVARQRPYKPRLQERRSGELSEEEIRTRQHKGRLNYLKRYAIKKDEILRCNSEWRKSNPAKSRAYRAKYRAAKLKATPIWADLKQVDEFYAKCPQGYEVDHIVPLQGETVCGLHVHYNLQYLSRSENRSKSNKLEGR